MIKCRAARSMYLSTTHEYEDVYNLALALSVFADDQYQLDNQNKYDQCTC